MTSVSQAASKCIPDLTRQLYRATITASNGRIFRWKFSSRTVLIVEVKTMVDTATRAAKRDILHKARRQAHEQAQHVFDEDKHIKYLGVIVACGEKWMYFEYERDRIRPVGWSDTMEPRASIWATPMSVLAREEAERQDQSRYDPPPGKDFNWDNSEWPPSLSALRPAPGAFKRYTRGDAQVDAAHHRPVLVVDPLDDTRFLCPDFLKNLLSRSDSDDLDVPLFQLMDGRGASWEAISRISWKLREKNSDLCGNVGFPRRNASLDPDQETNDVFAGGTAALSTAAVAASSPPELILEEEEQNAFDVDFDVEMHPVLENGNDALELSTSAADNNPTATVAPSNV